jgi:hypothetical protein
MGEKEDREKAEKLAAAKKRVCRHPQWLFQDYYIEKAPRRQPLNPEYTGYSSITITTDLHADRLPSYRRRKRKPLQARSRLRRTRPAKTKHSSQRILRRRRIQQKRDGHNRVQVYLEMEVHKLKQKLTQMKRRSTMPSTLLRKPLRLPTQSLSTPRRTPLLR